MYASVDMEARFFLGIFFYRCWPKLWVSTTRKYLQNTEHDGLTEFLNSKNGFRPKILRNPDILIQFR
jgi:hypothetical protein